MLSNTGIHISHNHTLLLELSNSPNHNIHLVIILPNKQTNHADSRAILRRIYSSQVQYTYSNKYAYGSQLFYIYSVSKRKIQGHPLILRRRNIQWLSSPGCSRCSISNQYLAILTYKCCCIHIICMVTLEAIGEQNSESTSLYLWSFKT